jgi:hypothetical protein
MSGIVKSVHYPNVFWVHNDSGDEPRLFPIRADGSAIMPSWLGREFYTGPQPVEGKKPYPGVRIDVAANSDWEDIAIDRNTLYIADTGNNGNARRDLGIYVVAEPNPEATFQTRSLKWLPIAYPDQSEFPGMARWQFDCEAMFVFKGKPYLVTKHHAPGKLEDAEAGANIYRLDTSHTDKVNVLAKVDGASDLGGWVTSAKLSPDGKSLAILCESPVSSSGCLTRRDAEINFCQAARVVSYSRGRNSARRSALTGTILSSLLMNSGISSGSPSATLSPFRADKVPFRYVRCSKSIVYTRAVSRNGTRGRVSE